MFCIRCGRKIPEGSSFCDDCAPAFEKPLEESAYLSARVSLPARDTAVQRPAPQEDSIAVRDEGRRPRLLRWRLAVLGLLCLCVGLAGTLCWGVYHYYGDEASRGRNQQWVQEEENARLSAQVAKLQTQLREVEEAASGTGGLLDEARREILRLEEELNQFVLQGSETDLAARTLQQENVKLQRENDSLKLENTELGQQLQLLETELQQGQQALEQLEQELDEAGRELDEALQDLERSRLAQKSLSQELESLRQTVGRLLRKSNFVDQHIAFVEAGDPGVYHTYECARFLKQSYWAYSVELARSNGYVPCPDCH